MSSFLISSYSLSAASRSGVFRAQSELRDAQKEVTTGRLADVGLALGTGSTRSISMRVELQTVDRQRETNDVLAQRFDGMQAALTSIADTAEGFMTTLLANGGNSSTGVTVNQAKSSLEQLMAALNTSSGGRYLFSGAASDQPAIAFRSVPDAFGTTVAVAAYDQGSSAKAATADAFLTAFGTTSDGAAVGTISAADLQAFLDGPFADLFGDAGAGGDGWGNFSGTTTDPVYNQIDASSRVNTAYSAASEAFRNIAKAYVMLSDLGAAGMSEDARQLLTSQATETLGKGIGQLTEMRGQIGAAQARIEDTDTALKSRSNVVTASLNSLEEVDPYEASVRVTNLTNLLESSYALTARISRLSLLNYL